MRRLASSLAMLAASAAFAASCGDLFSEPTQCRFERDCAKFGDATCDLARGVCVAKGSLEPDASAPPVDPPQDAGEDAPLDDRCAIDPKPLQPVMAKEIDAGTETGPDAEITGAVTLDCTKDWLLEGRVIVRPGATLTIEAGTTIRADTARNAGLVVMPGARIVADGRRNAPIVITSSAATPEPGDWRGVFVLGSAPPAGQAPYGGDPLLAWGGDNADDDSGVLRFVRIEYGAFGLVLAGAGKGTTVDHVQVRKTTDDCIRFHGGRVDAKHLVCQYPTDEMFEFGAQYAGRVQFLFGQKTPTGNVGGRNGILTDNSSPVLYNLTLCGDDEPNNGYGLVVRNSNVDVNGAILTGWFAGLDTVGNVAGRTPLEIRSSVAFGNATNPAYDENDTVNTGAPAFDDDNGFSELDWFGDPARQNRVTNPNLVGCFSPNAPKPWPAAPLLNGAPSPPDDGFFETGAKFIGAFRDENDDWTGGWAQFSDR